MDQRNGQQRNQAEQRKIIKRAQQPNIQAQHELDQAPPVIDGKDREH